MSQTPPAVAVLDDEPQVRIAPVTRDAIHRHAVATLAPVAPLLLTMMPLEELLKTLFGALF